METEALTAIATELQTLNENIEFIFYCVWIVFSVRWAYRLVGWLDRKLFGATRGVKNQWKKN